MSNASTKPSAKGILLKGVFLLAAFWLGTGIADAYIRIVINGKNIHWDTNQVTWNFQADGSADITDGSLEAAMEHAFESWADVDGTALQLQRGADTTSHSVSGSSHMVMFDETNQSGWFPVGSGMVAVTPITYRTSDGKILDADILFNARDYTFSTDGSPGTFDVQDVLTHEVGHFIGLDHSPLHGSTMWPYVQAGQWLHRSLSHDDEVGALAVSNTGGISLLKGRILASDSSVIRGALVCVVLVSDGRLIASAATDATGRFTIKGLPLANYHVYTTPIEGGMTSANLSGNGAVDTDFGFAFYGSFSSPDVIAIAGSMTTDIGDLTAPNDAQIRDSFGSAIVLEQGQQKTIPISGVNFDAGDMVVSELSPYITVSNIVSNSTYVSARLHVSASCPPGLYDLYLSAGNGEYEVLPGAIQVAAPAPVIQNISPTLGTVAGGDEVRIDGTDFQEGAWVLVGGREATSVKVFDSTTIGFESPQGDPGTVNIRVVNPDGRQVIEEAAFLYSSIPTLTGLLPKAGQVEGGTDVLMVGSGFAPGITVTFDGTAGQVVLLTSNLIRVTTPSHLAGVVSLNFENPDGAFMHAFNRYTFVADADPEISTFTPDSGGDQGGTLVRLFGKNFPPGTRIKFGVDPVTGQGGHFAAGVEILSGREITSITPGAVLAGTYGLVAELPNGQAVLASTNFSFDSTFESGGSSSSSGGCAGAIGVGHPPIRSFSDLWRSLTSSWPSISISIFAWILLRRSARRR